MEKLSTFPWRFLMAFRKRFHVNGILAEGNSNLNGFVRSDYEARNWMCFNKIYTQKRWGNGKSWMKKVVRIVVLWIEYNDFDDLFIYNIYNGETHKSIIGNGVFSMNWHIIVCACGIGQSDVEIIWGDWFGSFSLALFWRFLRKAYFKNATL